MSKRNKHMTYTHTHTQWLLCTLRQVELHSERETQIKTTEKPFLSHKIGTESLKLNNTVYCGGHWKTYSCIAGGNEEGLSTL